MANAEYVVSIFLCLLYGTSGLPRVDPLVDANVGLIRGLVAPDGDYSMFLGIPYATVDPLNPFGLSIPHAGFDSTFDAVDDSAVCPQWDGASNSVIGTLDCLRLNVFVPNTATSRNLLPVMVYIHGGAYLLGSGSRSELGPKFLIRHDVVVVTLNYRLGTYGFLCPDIPEVPGNQGLKDQLTALRWIKNNIEAFGGDSNKITIFGESAGSLSVDFHLIYSQENLFNNVILQSGTAFTDVAFRESDPNGPIRLATYLGFAADNVYDALEFLRTVDPTLIILASMEADIVMNAGCVEKEYENVERYINAHPITANLPNARTVSILIGSNSNELALMYNGFTSQSTPFTIIRELFDFDDEYYQEILANVRHFYIGDEDISEEVRQQIIDFRSDFTFNVPNYRSIQKYFANGASTVYQYMFSYVGDRNYARRGNNATDVIGEVHADELSYLFDVAAIEEEPTPEDQLTIDRITALWTNFAKFGNPVPEVTDLLPVQWPTVTNENSYYLNIDSELSVQRRPFHDRMAYWDLFFRLNQKFLTTFEEN